MFGFVASTTSSTPFRSTRRRSSSIRRGEGSPPARGESAPPSTWYTPRYSCVRSTERRSAGCSTTQMIERSRRGAGQIAESSPPVRLPPSRQKPMRSLTSRIASASANASSSGTRRMWNASRCAVRVPTPGRRESCAIRLSTSGLNMPAYCLQARQAQSLEAAHGAAELRLHEVLGVLERLVHPCEDKVGQALRVIGVDDLGRNRDLDDFAGAARLHLDHPAADRSLDDLLG